MEQATLEQIPCALCRWDGAGALVEAGAWLGTLVGCPVADLLSGRTQLQDQILPADRAALAAVLREAAESGQPYETEYRIRPLDLEGEVRWLQERGRVLADGGRVGVILEPSGTLQHDQVVRLQQALVQIATHPAMVSGDLEALCQAITERAARILDVGRVSIWLLDDARSRMTMVDMFSLATEVHTQGAILLAEDYPAYFAAARSGWVVDAHAARSDPRTQEFRASYLEPLDIHSLLDAAVRVGGEVVGVVCLEATAARRRWLPLELSFAGELAEQVGHVLQRRQQILSRHSQATMAQALVRAQRMEAIGRLASGVAHDFNNLLTVILAATDSLSEPPPTQPRHSDALRLLREATRRSTRLIEQLLTISPQRDAAPAAMAPVPVLQELEALLRQLLGPSVGLSMALEPVPCCVPLTPVQLEQIVMNLVINARNAMPDGGRLALRCSAVTLTDVQIPTIPAGHYFCLEVEDSGPGIPAALREQIFEPFFTTGPAGRSTGLGLSTVYGLVRQASGEILLQDAVPHGAHFRIYLPLLPDAAQDSGQAEAVLRRQALVVEEDAQTRHMLARLLRTEGVAVVGVASADAGRGWLASASSLSLLLLSLEALDGERLALAAQAQARFPEAPVIYLSGALTPEDLAPVVGAAAAERFLAKPFRLEALLRLLRA